MYKTITVQLKLVQLQTGYECVVKDSEQALAVINHTLI